MIVGYGRCSTARQLEGLTKERQIQTLTEAGATEIIFDVESGKSTDRKGYKQLCSLILAGKVSTIICVRLDRLGRSISDLNRFYKLCFDNEVDLRLLDFGTNLKSPAGKIIYAVLSALAEVESDTLSTRIKAAWDYKRSNLIAGRLPMGLKRDSNGKPIINLEEAALIKEVLKLVLEAGSVAQGCREFNAKHPECLFSLRTLTRLLRNPHLRGHTVFGVASGDYIEARDTHEAVITPQEYSKIEEIISINTKSRSNNANRQINPLSGLCFCAACGSSMRIRHRGRRSNKGVTYSYRRLVCSRWIDFRENGCTSNHSVKPIDVEAAIIKALLVKAPKIAASLSEVSDKKENSCSGKELILRSQLVTLRSIPNPTSPILDAIVSIENDLKAIELESQIKFSNELSYIELLEEIQTPGFFESLSLLDKSLTFRALVKKVTISFQGRSDFSLDIELNF